MYVNIKKFVIVAFWFFHLSWETSAAVIFEAEGAEAIDRAEAVGGVEVVLDGLEFNPDGLEFEATEVEDIKVFEGPATYKCGNLSCPNGAFCEIKQNPDFAEKKVTITTQCRDTEGKFFYSKMLEKNLRLENFL